MKKLTAAKVALTKEVKQQSEYPADLKMMEEGHGDVLADGITGDIDEVMAVLEIIDEIAKPAMEGRFPSTEKKNELSKPEMAGSFEGLDKTFRCSCGRQAKKNDLEKTGDYTHSCSRCREEGGKDRTFRSGTYDVMKNLKDGQRVKVVDRIYKWNESALELIPVRKSGVSIGINVVFHKEVEFSMRHSGMEFTTCVKMEGIQVEY